MFGINEILGKVFSRKSLTEEERYNILRSKGVDPAVITYLMKILKYLYIEVLGDYEGSLFTLMSEENLLGWCWETTESAIVFFNDDDYIERGYLYIDEKMTKYYHSWICFNYNGVEYVLDPCLNILCKKRYYSKIFKTKVLAKIYAKAVKDELIRQILGQKKEDNSESAESFEKFMRSVIGDSYDKIMENKKGEVIAHGPEDINTPLYRNGAGYKADIENGRIKKLTAHYYYTDC